MKKSEAAFAKFKVLRTLVAHRPEMVDYFSKKEEVAKNMLGKYGEGKAVVNSLHEELSVWTKDLLEPLDRAKAKAEFSKIDAMVN